METLNSLGFALWLARFKSSPFEKRVATNNARRALANYFRQSLNAVNHAPQRENLNRRQLRAERAGVSVMHRAQPFGLDFAVRKWA